MELKPLIITIVNGSFQTNALISHFEDCSEIYEEVGLERIKSFKNAIA